jgi:hypothetical protein
VGQPSAQLRKPRVEQFRVPAREELGQGRHVASIGLHRVLGEPPLKTEVLCELGHSPYVGGCGGN